MSDNEKFYPLKFTPVLKDYIWGGRNLEKLGRLLPPDGVIAETWEIAAHKDGRAGHQPAAGYPVKFVNL